MSSAPAIGHPMSLLRAKAWLEEYQGSGGSSPPAANGDKCRPELMHANRALGPTHSLQKAKMVKCKAKNKKKRKKKNKSAIKMLSEQVDAQQGVAITVRATKRAMPQQNMSKNKNKMTDTTILSRVPILSPGINPTAYAKSRKAFESCDLEDIFDETIALLYSLDALKVPKHQHSKKNQPGQSKLAHGARLRRLECWGNDATLLEALRDLQTKRANRALPKKPEFVIEFNASPHCRPQSAAPRRATGSPGDPAVNLRPKSAPRSRPTTPKQRAIARTITSEGDRARKDSQLSPNALREEKLRRSQDFRVSFLTRSHTSFNRNIDILNERVQRAKAREKEDVLHQKVQQEKTKRTSEPEPERHLSNGDYDVQDGRSENKFRCERHLSHEDSGVQDGRPEVIEGQATLFRLVSSTNASLVDVGSANNPSLSRAHAELSPRDEKHLEVLPTDSARKGNYTETKRFSEETRPLQDFSSMVGKKNLSATSTRASLPAAPAQVDAIMDELDLGKSSKTMSSVATSEMEFSTFSTGLPQSHDTDTSARDRTLESGLERIIQEANRTTDADTDSPVQSAQLSDRAVLKVSTLERRIEKDDEMVSASESAHEHAAASVGDRSQGVQTRSYSLSLAIETEDENATTTETDSVRGDSARKRTCQRSFCSTGTGEYSPGESASDESENVDATMDQIDFDVTTPTPLARASKRHLLSTPTAVTTANSLSNTLETNEQKDVDAIMDGLDFGISASTPVSYVSKKPLLTTATRSSLSIVLDDANDVEGKEEDEVEAIMGAIDFDITTPTPLARASKRNLLTTPRGRSLRSARNNEEQSDMDVIMEGLDCGTNLSISSLRDSRETIQATSTRNILPISLDTGTDNGAEDVDAIMNDIGFGITTPTPLGRSSKRMLLATPAGSSLLGTLEIDEEADVDAIMDFGISTPTPLASCHDMRGTLGSPSRKHLNNKSSRDVSDLRTALLSSPQSGLGSTTFSDTTRSAGTIRDDTVEIKEEEPAVRSRSTEGDGFDLDEDLFGRLDIEEEEIGIASSTANEYQESKR